jgi:glycosyltransferase involved in cell wall biosynthesis
MNILQLSFHTSPYSELGVNDGGGLNLYVQQISKYLSNNHNVTVVTAEKAESFKKENLEFYSLNLFEPDLPMEDKELHLIEFQKKLEETFELNNFDIIHSHYWLSGLVAKDISDKFNIPYIFTSHSLGVFLEGYNNERADCEKIIMTAANFVTASSNYENSLISESYKIDKKKIKLIKPGVDENLFSPDPSLSRENIILSIGRIQKQKRQLEAIEFLNTFREIENDFKCYFIGGPSGTSGDDYFLELKEIVKELSLESHVEFLGNLPQSKIRELLNRSKLLIHTSQYETFGLVAIEAHSVGVPVVSINQGSFKEIIDNNINGYIAESFEDQYLNEFILKIFNDDKFADYVSKSAINSSKKYDWKHTSEKLNLLYQELKLR